MLETIETCRRLYNALLDDRIKNRTNCFAQKRIVTAVRHEDKYLKAIHSEVAQQVVFRLDRSFARFFAGLSLRPRFKRRGRYRSFTYPQLGGFRVVDGKLRLSKIGLINVRPHYSIEGSPKTCTIIRDIDQWYACISVERLQPNRTKLQSEATAIGVDLGILNLATLSNGKVFQNPRFLEISIPRIKSLQRRLSKKRKDSHNRERARILLAKAWRKLRNQRLDVLHKISVSLAAEYSTVVFEDLRIRNMVRNHKLASAITDASWGKLRHLTTYKVERRGGRVILVDPSGTSQKCSGCGAEAPKELSERVHDCQRCGLVMDRDVNAAKNILRAGLERARAEEQPLPVQRRRTSKFVPVKQKTHGAECTRSSRG
jgi:putative transposase